LNCGSLEPELLLEFVCCDGVLPASVSAPNIPKMITEVIAAMRRQDDIYSPPQNQKLYYSGRRFMQGKKAKKRRQRRK
jgi:hypothetical protein